MTYRVAVRLRDDADVQVIFQWCEDTFTPEQIVRIDVQDAGTPLAIATFLCEEAAAMFRLRWG